jgi:hypothetical protein
LPLVPTLVWFFLPAIIISPDATLISA